MQEAGKTFAGRYRIEREVGRGGMAVVYRAFDERVKRTVALKVLYPYLAVKQENKVRFQREAEVVANLDHRNVVKVFDYSGIDSQDNFIVAEFVEGTTLKRFVADNPLILPEVGAMIVHEIGAALEHAHRNHVTHRDVKPENVMIGRDGVLKLMDFGIAQIKDVHSMTVTGTMIGSPAHMSPEHIEGRNLDHRADIFSLGTVLYRLCVGELPFAGNTPHALLKRILDANYTPANQANPAVGNRLAAIIDRCLRKEPEERYQTCAELQHDLVLHLERFGLQDCPAELARFFKNPRLYQEAAVARVIEALVKSGRKEVRKSRIAVALRRFDRALCLDSTRDDIVVEIERLQRSVERRRFLFRYALPAVGVIALAAVTAFGAANSGLLGSIWWGDDQVEMQPVALMRPGGVADAAAREWADTRSDWADTNPASADRGVIKRDVASAAGDVSSQSPDLPAPDIQRHPKVDPAGMLMYAKTMGDLRAVSGAARNIPDAVSTLRNRLVRLDRLRREAGAKLDVVKGDKEGRNGSGDKVPRDHVVGDRENGKAEKTQPEGSQDGGGPESVAELVAVTIRPWPPAAEVWIDEQSFGTGKVSGHMLQEGTHKVRLHYPKCAFCVDAVNEVVVSANGPDDFSFSVGYKPALLRVQSAHKGMVFVNDRVLGATNELLTVEFAGTRVDMLDVASRKHNGQWGVAVKVLFDDRVLPHHEEKVRVGWGRVKVVKVGPPASTVP